jgi:hypothetical protein
MAKAVVTERCEMRKRDREVHRFDDDETLDGETIRTPMVLMDSMAGYRRGYVQLTDDAITKRRAARDSYIRNMTTAWDSRERRREPDDFDEDSPGRERYRRSYDFAPARSRVDDAAAYDIADAARTASYLAMCDRVSNAWRRPVRDAAQPDQGSTPAELARHMRADPDEDAAARREKSYAAYKARLEVAWRNPAAAAERNEMQLEAWRKPGARPGLHQDAIKDSSAAYAAYVERIGRAWRAA